MRPAKKLKGERDLGDSTVKDESSEALLEFLSHSCLILRSDLFASKSAGSRRGLFAQKDIPEGTVLFAHKFDFEAREKSPSILSFTACRERRKAQPKVLSLYDALLRQPGFDPSGFIGTVCCLMIEIMHKDTSHLYPYLNWLPNLHEGENKGVPLCALSLWSESALSKIQGTSVYLEARQFQTASKTAFTTSFEKLTPLVKYLQNNGVAHIWKFYGRCCACVQAYSFTVQETEDSPSAINVMVPAMDAFNASVSLQNVGLFVETARLECRATKDIIAGSEIFNTFGEMTMADRLLRYGYHEAQDEYTLVFVYSELIAALSVHVTNEIAALLIAAAAKLLEVDLQALKSEDVLLHTGERPSEFEETLLYDILLQLDSTLELNQTVAPGKIAFDCFMTMLQTRKRELGAKLSAGGLHDATGKIATVVERSEIDTLALWIDYYGAKTCLA